MYRIAVRFTDHRANRVVTMSRKMLVSLIGEDGFDALYNWGDEVRCDTDPSMKLRLA